METKPDYNPLSEQQIQEGLQLLPGWTMQRDGEAIFLTRTYRFPGFLQAIAFMHTVAPAIEQLNHHPEWHNVYNRIAVRLTTHDRGNQLTPMDLRLAHLLDEHFLASH